MLVINPASSHGRFGAVLSALIIVACVVGLTMHKDFYAGRRRRGYFFFYTNLSNLLVLLYFSLIAPRLYVRPAPPALIARAEFSLMMCIMLTFTVFHFLLFPSVRRTVCHAQRTREFRIMCADNLIVHYLVPLLVLLYWLLCSPGKALLSLSDAFYWTLIPLFYLAAVLLRAHSGQILDDTESPYPYPFLDIRVLGAARVFGFCLRIYALCLMAGTGVILFTRILQNSP